CSVPDYGTEEIKGKIMQAKGVGLAKQDNLTERIIANIKQIEVHSKIEVDINIDNKIEVVDKTSNEFDKVKDISSSIWAPVSKSLQRLNRKFNSLVESYKKQNLKGESETKRKRNQEVYKKAKRDDYKGTKDNVGKFIEKAT
ncbi:8493_t:CDS:2, partial [Gigaspora margarita]